MSGSKERKGSKMVGVERGREKESYMYENISSTPLVCIDERMFCVSADKIEYIAGGREDMASGLIKLSVTKQQSNFLSFENRLSFASLSCFCVWGPVNCCSIADAQAVLLRVDVISSTSTSTTTHLLFNPIISHN
jgi:hypothetical protein